MYAMQYSVPLPADYDMRIIRDRVARTGHLLDGFSGLDFKAYLIREKANGAPVNEYAPFYVWNDIDGMRAFCWGEPGYSAIVRDFGRRPIQDWTLIGLVSGPRRLDEARSMSISTRPLPAGVAPVHVVQDLTGGFLSSAGSSTVRRVAAVDVTTWTLLLAELGADQPTVDGEASSYEVLHVSPGPDS
ncbi:DUF4865 family protein [Nocardiopsis akebiae]|uniref:DUF4865 family protein n=1 Tax=Nocardiopsis akebiae TaxID=2831968 RepID=A0ABX8BY87_9ACTN|nr:DUF4865 family protein [Nocardiopsis akebiae]QUX26952.1 DUF4865 family protein [Nocardiopsis akebiae]